MKRDEASLLTLPFFPVLLDRVLLPEAVAIVLAPRYTPSYCIFRLTDPLGMQTIAACKEVSAFHQHRAPLDKLYTEVAIGDGQIEILPYSEGSFKVADLR